MWKTLHVWVKNSHRLPNVCWGILHSKQTILLSLIPDEHPGDVAWENSDATNRFSAKWHLRNKCRNSILMMCCYPDLSSASDWFNKIVNRTKALPKSGKCWSLAWNFCAQMSFPGETVLVASQNVSCFLRLGNHSLPRLQAHLIS